MSDNQTNQNVPEQSLKVVAQYLKDLSFENPGHGPLAMLNKQNPDININVFVNTKKDPKDPSRNYIDLTLKAFSKVNETPLFILEATYSGIFDIVGFADELEEQILNIQCPSLLFPFLRRIVGEKTADGGYPPLYLDPIDFYAIYMHKKATLAKKAAEIKDKKNDDDTDEDLDDTVTSVFN